MTRSDGPVDAFERALVAVRALPPPPPPPFDSTRLDRPPRSIRWKVLAGVATVAAASIVFAWTRQAPDAVSLPFEIRSGAEFLRTPTTAQWIASGPASLTFGRAEVTVEAGTTFGIAFGSRFDVHKGRASFHMTKREPAGRYVRGANFDPVVTAGKIGIVDHGTTFDVDVTPGTGHEEMGERVLVTVTEGWVTAADAEIRTGEGLAFLDRIPLGAAWPLGAKPTVSLEPESDDVTAGESIVLRVILRNATDGWIAWPSSGAVENPVHVEVTGPDGAVTPVRVTDAMLVEGPASGRAIPPRGQSVLRVRFDRTFASPGTYRLRAIFRPAEAVEDPASASISLTVRGSLTVRAPGATIPAGPPTPGRPR